MVIGKDPGGRQVEMFDKRRLLEVGMLTNRYSECGITEWRGGTLSMQLHHRNGVNHDHRLENLIMLCPDRHSQTSTFAARDKKKTSLGRETR